jgi:hypothetical protein
VPTHVVFAGNVGDDTTLAYLDPLVGGVLAGQLADDRVPPGHPRHPSGRRALASRRPAASSTSTS